MAWSILGSTLDPVPASPAGLECAPWGWTMPTSRKRMRREEYPKLVGPFTDIFPTTRPHEWLWLAILDLVRLIRLLKPTIIRAEGAESARILMTGIAADSVPSNLTTAQSRMLDSFFGQKYQGSALALDSVVRPSATRLRFETLPPPDFLSWIEDVVIAQVGPDPVADLAIIIANVSLLVSGC